MATIDQLDTGCKVTFKDDKNIWTIAAFNQSHSKAYIELGDNVGLEVTRKYLCVPIEDLEPWPGVTL